MDEFEKIEKLVEKANVSFEEARDALKACDGDLLDAMVYLEKLGKTSGPTRSSFSTSYEEQEQYEDVGEKVKNMNTKARETTLGEYLRKFWEFLWNNSFSVSRGGKEIVKVPVWLLVIALFINWRLSTAVLVVALFFGCRYAFAGRDNLSGANSFMDKAGDVADQFKEKVKNGFNENNKNEE